MLGSDARDALISPLIAAIEGLSHAPLPFHHECGPVKVEIHWHSLFHTPALLTQEAQPLKQKVLRFDQTLFLLKNHLSRRKSNF
jgi:hypothetical protein